MKNVLRRLKTMRAPEIVKNKVLLFTANRYFSYGLQFLRGLLVARYLGIFYFGIWGFLMMIRQYLVYTSLGIEYAVNVELATDSKEFDKNQEEIIHVALSGVVIIAGFLIIGGVAIQILNLPLFIKYSFSEYAIILFTYVGLIHIRQVLTNIYRVYGKLLQIGVSEFITATLPLIVAFFFRGQALIIALLAALIVSEIISVIVLIVGAPFRLSFSLLPGRIRGLISIGVPLLVYNIGFRLKMLTGRTIISAFFSVDSMGYYSFANTMTKATLLGLKAVGWVVYPDILSKTSNSIPDKAAADTIKKVNDLYGTAVILVVYVVIIVMPLLFLVLPEYKPVEETLGILLLSQAIESLSFGYNSAAVARKQTVQVAKNSWIAVAVVGICGSLVSFFNFDFLWVAVSILAGSLVFTILQVQLGSKVLHESDMKRSWSKVLPTWTILSFIVTILAVLRSQITIGAILGLIIFIITNSGKIINLFDFVINRILSVETTG
jgi:O-antigen/teichoic acid export membrane protein